jgi:hypothetical protein
MGDGGMKLQINESEWAVIDGERVSVEDAAGNVLREAAGVGFVGAITALAETFANDPLRAHRDALAAAREILLDYRFGAPGTPTFPEVLSPVQTAVLAYRDSGIRDAECDEHIMWINARVNEINAAALYGAGVLK